MYFLFLLYSSLLSSYIFPYYPYSILPSHLDKHKSQTESQVATSTAAPPPLGQVAPHTSSTRIPRDSGILEAGTEAVVWQQPGSKRLYYCLQGGAYLCLFIYLTSSCLFIYFCYVSLFIFFFPPICSYTGLSSLCPAGHLSQIFVMHCPSPHLQDIETIL